MTAATNTALTINPRSSDIFQISLGDESGQSILSIDDGALRQSLQIDIVNTSGKSIELMTLAGVTSPSQTSYHFCISFRPGTLAADLPDKPISLKIAEDGWVVKRDKNDFYLLRTSSKNKVVQNNDRITLTLENISAAPAGGSRGTRVEVKYNNIQYDGPGEPISGTRLHYLNIVNHRGKKQVPLYVDFWGSNTILNDNSENKLTLSIQVLPRLDDPSKTVEVSTLSKAIDLNLQKLTPKQVGISQKIVSTISSIKWDDLKLTEPQKVSVTQIENDLKPLVEMVSYPPLTLQDPQEIYKMWQEIYGKLKEVLKNISNADKQKTVESLFKQYSEQFGGFELVSSQQDLETILFFLKDLEIDVPSELLSKLSIITENQNLLSLKGSSSSGDGATKFTISFDVAGSSSDSLSWALTSKEDASNIVIQHEPPINPNWTATIDKQGISPQWSFTCKNDLDLTSFREILSLNITNIKTTLRSGFANLYFHYKNIPGYWDGFITVPIHKGPLVYREYPNSDSPATDNMNKVGCVGIGTEKPQAKLHVKTSTNVLGLKVEGNTEITGDSTLTGKVGIGTPSGTEQLQIKGNALFDSASGANQLQILAWDSEGWNIQTKSDGKHLYLNRDSLSKSNVYIGRENSELFVRGSDGNVGIGTSVPEAKLHLKVPTSSDGLKVEGNAAIIGNLSVTTVDLSVTTTDNKILLHRKSNTAVNGSQIFLELRQESQSNIYPSILFHNTGQFWHRIEARTDGLHIKVGDISKDDYTSIIAKDLEVKTKPIHFMRFNALGKNITTKTGYLGTEFCAAITGFNAFGGDINEYKDPIDISIIKVYMKVINNEWNIIADFKTSTAEDWSVDVMFVSNKIAQAITDFQGNLGKS